MQVADAAQATLGLDIAGVVVTEVPLGVEKWIDEKTGQSTGRLDNSTVLVDAVKHLVRGCGAEAIAVVGRFPDKRRGRTSRLQTGSGEGSKTPFFVHEFLRDRHLNQSTSEREVW